MEAVTTQKAKHEIAITTREARVLEASLGCALESDVFGWASVDIAYRLRTGLRLLIALEAVS